MLFFCRYIEDRHNCFDFVIFFLKQVGFSRQNLSAESRSALTHDIILPQMSKVVQYITLYRNIASFSYVCQDVQTKSLMKKWRDVYICLLAYVNLQFEFVLPFLPFSSHIPTFLINKTKIHVLKWNSYSTHTITRR